LGRGRGFWTQGDEAIGEGSWSLEKEFWAPRVTLGDGSFGDWSKKPIPPQEKCPGDGGSESGRSKEIRGETKTLIKR